MREEERFWGYSQNCSTGSLEMPQGDPIYFYCGDGTYGLHYIFKSDQIKSKYWKYILNQRKNKHLDGLGLKLLFNFVIILLRLELNIYVLFVFFNNISISDDSFFSLIFSDQ